MKKNLAILILITGAFAAPGAAADNKLKAMAVEASTSAVAITGGALSDSD